MNIKISPPDIKQNKHSRVLWCGWRLSKYVLEVRTNMKDIIKSAMYKQQISNIKKVSEGIRERITSENRDSRRNRDILKLCQCINMLIKMLNDEMELRRADLKIMDAQADQLKALDETNSNSIKEGEKNA